MSNLLGGYLSATFNPLSGAPTTVEYLVVAGGGGGGYDQNGYSGSGGGSGGGYFVPSYPASAGGGNSGYAESSTVNTPSGNGLSGTGGGGGGGGNNNTAGQIGGNGGSGIVIIRYPATQSAPTATTGNPQINYADGYQIYTWTSSGTVTF